MIAFSKEDSQNIILYDTYSGKKIKRLTSNTGKDKVLSFRVNSSSRKIYAISKKYIGDNVIQVWNIDDGNLIQEKNIPYKYEGNFTIDEKYIIFKESPHRINIIDTDGFGYPYGIRDAQIAFGDYGSVAVVYWQDGNDVKIWKVGNTTPISLKNIELKSQDHLSSSSDLQLYVTYGTNRPSELWDLKEKKLLRLLPSSKDKHIQSVAFSMNDTAVVITEEGGVASLFDAKDGSPLAQHISVASVYYYDPDLRRIHLWNRDGQVIRLVEGRSYFGWFVPTKKGAQD